MKKIIFVLLLFVSVLGFSQTQLGIKIAPTFVSNRAKNDSLTANGDATKARFSLGLIIDQPLSEMYFFSTGLIYMPKTTEFSVNSIFEEYKLQYLQLPITMKLFTNEIAPDFKAYLQIGGGMEIKIYDEKMNKNYNIISEFSPIDFSAIIGGGAEYKLGINTTVFLGVSYQRGLINVVKTTPSSIYEDLQIRNTVFSIDLGIKF